MAPLLWVLGPGGRPASSGEEGHSAGAASEPALGATSGDVAGQAVTKQVQPRPDSEVIPEHGAIVASARLRHEDLHRALEGRVDPELLGTQNLAHAMTFGALDIELEGVDAGAPLSVLMVGADAGLGVAALVEIEDSEGLVRTAEAAGLSVRSRDGLGLVGEPAFVDAAEDFAFEHLRAAPDHSELVIYPALLELLVSEEAEQDIGPLVGRESALGVLLAAHRPLFFEWARVLVSQVDHVNVSLARDADSSEVFVHIYPRSGTELETFIAAQRPSDYGLLDEIPGPGWPDYIIAGDVELAAGAASEQLVEVLVKELGALFGPARGGRSWSELSTDWISTLTGELALAQVRRPLGPSAQGVIMLGSRKGESSQASWRELRAAQGPVRIGIPSHLELDLDGQSYDDVMIDVATRRSLPGGEVPAGQELLVNYSAGFDQRWVFVDPKPLTVAKVINAVRGHGEFSTLAAAPELVPALADSRALGESVLVWIRPRDSLNVAGLPIRGEALTIGLGRRGDALSVHLGLR